MDWSGRMKRSAYPPQPNELEHALMMRGFRPVLEGEEVKALPGDPAVSIKMLASDWRKVLAAMRRKSVWMFMGGIAFGMLLGYLWRGWFPG